MTETVRLDIAAAESLATEALVASRTSPANAALTARALVAAEIDGQAGHGVFRVPTYALQSRTGKVNGFATPQVEHVAAASVRVDGQLGFAYPAVKLAEEHLVALARKHGITAAVIHRSHHFGQAGAHAERLACVGLIAL
ncbi:MAG TPA: Ldh family oxidoreductase, partial [Steroidobacteraceae bacterium]|nr:Ldh family oxidoreductase [Steroidobacteraceae bacterium]